MVYLFSQSKSLISEIQNAKKLDRGAGEALDDTAAMCMCIQLYMHMYAISVYIYIYFHTYIVSCPVVQPPPQWYGSRRPNQHLINPNLSRRDLKPT